MLFLGTLPPGKEVLTFWRRDTFLAFTRFRTLDRPAHGPVVIPTILSLLSVQRSTPAPSGS